MTDPGKALQIAYVALLSGILVGDAAIPVYGALAPTGAEAPYIILSRAETRNASQKNAFGYRLSVTLDVVTRFGPGPVDELVAETIVEALLALLFPTPTTYPLAPAGFSLWACSLQNVRPITDRTPTGTLIRRLITIDHQLHPV